MRPKWHNKNSGKSPQDPSYLEGYDPEKDSETFDEACEAKEEQKKYSHEND